MLTQIFTIIISLLAIIVGLWKYFTGKAREKQKRKEDAAKKINDGVDSGNTSDITIGMDRLRRK